LTCPKALIRIHSFKLVWEHVSLISSQCINRVSVVILLRRQGPIWGQDSLIWGLINQVKVSKGTTKGIYHMIGTCTIHRWILRRLNKIQYRDRCLQGQSMVWNNQENCWSKDGRILEIQERTWTLKFKKQVKDKDKLASYKIRIENLDENAGNCSMRYSRLNQNRKVLRHK
jgi:hypothetical protein